MTPPKKRYNGQQFDVPNKRTALNLHTAIIEQFPHMNCDIYCTTDVDWYLPDGGPLDTGFLEEMLAMLALSGV